MKPRWPAASLRTCLVALMMVASVPMAVFMSVQIVRDGQGQMRQMKSQLAVAAAAMASSIERELTASTDSLDLLAHASALRDGDVERFGSLLGGWPRPVLRESWQSVFVHDARLQRTVFSSRPAPWAWPLGGASADGPQRVTGLVRSPDGRWAVAVAVRVGEGPYWLGAWIEASYWQALLDRAGRPEGGFATLYDARHHIIARTLSPGRFVGELLPPGAIAHMGKQASGVHRAALLEGGHTYAAWQRLSRWGWGVGTGVPAGPLEQQAERSMLAAFGMAAACLLAGVFVSLRLARQITRPLAALGAGQAWDGEIPVREIAVLRDALAAAKGDEAAARLRLQHKADEFAAVFNGSPIGLAFAQDREAEHRLFNAALDALLQAPTGGAGPAQVLKDGQAIPFEQTPLAVAAASGEPVDATELELRWSGTDASRIVVAQAVPLRDAEGRPRGAIAAVVDVTERQRAEQAVQQASHAKDRFLAMLSHELRNPLNAIASAAEVLQLLGDDVGQRAEAADARGIIARQTRHLAHLVNGLLDTARVVAGDAAFESAPLDLARTAGELAARQALAAEVSVHRFEMDLREVWATADRARIEQVLINLLENARKYTPAGGCITLNTYAEGADAVLEVSDTGHGIPPELLAQAFDAFVQGHRSFDRQQGGLGLGLALVQRIVQMHGGTVTASSSVRGSTFRVALPRIDAPRAEPSLGGLRHATPRNVLVVDDNSDALRALRSALELEGHQVHAALDGETGLRLLLAKRPEVAVIDLGLPGIDGYEVARRSRAAGHAGCLVALSGYSSQGNVRDALQAGFDMQLAKPVDFDRLREVLAQPL